MGEPLMQTRRGHGLKVVPANGAVPPNIVRLSIDPARPAPLRKSEGYIWRGGDMPPGFAWYAMLDADKQSPVLPDGASAIFLPPAFDHIGDGDLIRVFPERGNITVLFQHAARHHSFLLTERCNNYCLMCSQPPRDVNDYWIFDDLMAAIPLIDPETPEIGFTGGEPTLLGERLVRLIRQCKSYLPRTGLHVLSNGRAFASDTFTRMFAGVNHHDLMFGIPIYSDLSHVHDYVVQADGAFDETVRGVLNLKRHGLKVEIRVVVHKQTYERLPDLARFLTRNLTFVDQIVFMGLEMTGFTKANFDDLWIDPVDYQAQLVEAVRHVAASRIHVSVYNHQLCITDRSLWPYARQSISDWKNEYMPECEGCAVRTQCAGFFSSAKLKYSAHIRPITA
jgi:His-Xaa-Ser system radical SAM maturase HxsC